MKDYFNSLLLFSVFYGICSHLTDGFSKTKKYVSYLLSLCMLLCAFSPLFSVFKGGNLSVFQDFINSLNTEEMEKESKILITNTTKTSFENRIKEHVIKTFGFEESDVYVNATVESDESAIYISQIEVILTNHASWYDTNRVKEDLSNYIQAKIIVTRR